MNQPIKLGKLINNRYLVKLILGQGRFNQTYLTEDTHRFHELCIVKKLIFQTQDPVVRQKITEIFQRQAEILYRIYHPQLANFREIFQESEDNQSSIFLVQDYIKGKTYEDLLTLRRSQEKLFSEAEIILLLQQLLFILKYLHEKRIVHRDICPQNIIQRESDLLPILIDFSSIKSIDISLKENEKINNINGQPRTSSVLIQLGKMTFWPKDRNFTESVSVNNDIYSLGATAIVLLTGKDISQLTDTQQNLEEILSQHSISPRLTNILLKMLAKPTESYFSSAQEILDMLNMLNVKFFESNNIEKNEETILKDTSKDISATSSKSNSLPSVDIKNSNIAAISQSKSFFWGCLGKLSLLLLLVTTSGSLGWFAGKIWLVKILQPKNTVNSNILTSENPFSKPSSPLPQDNSSSNNPLQTRRKTLGIDRLFFNNLVDQTLEIQNTNDQNKTASKEEEWEKAANLLLDKLSKLSPEALQHLGRYNREQRSNWTKQVNQLHLSSRALTNLVNIRFFKDFPELENQDFMEQPLGQVWYAIAVDMVKSLETKQNYELLITNATQTNQQLIGKLQPGEGKAYVISLTASKPMEVKLQASPDALLTIYSPTGQEILLDNSRTHQWSGILPESGYYEILVTSKAKEPFDYQLNLSAW